MGGLDFSFYWLELSVCSSIVLLFSPLARKKKEAKKRNFLFSRLRFRVLRNSTKGVAP